MGKFDEVFVFRIGCLKVTRGYAVRAAIVLFECGCGFGIYLCLNFPDSGLAPIFHVEN